MEEELEVLDGFQVRRDSGRVKAKIVFKKLHVEFQAAGVNFDPLEITMCSKQCVPERASCS